MARVGSLILSDRPPFDSWLAPRRRFLPRRERPPSLSVGASPLLPLEGQC
jgi:hypothetical protein